MDKQKKELRRKAFIDWWKKHNGEIVRIGYYTLGAAVGYFVGKQFNLLSMSIGMSKLHSEGIIKFFDPNTCLEVGTEKAAELISKLVIK